MNVEEMSSIIQSGMAILEERIESQFSVTNLFAEQQYNMKQLFINHIFAFQLSLQLVAARLVYLHVFQKDKSYNIIREISVPFSIQLSLMLQAEHLAVMLFGGANSHDGKNVGHVSLLTFGSLQKYPIRKFGQAATYLHMATRYSQEGSVFYGTPCVDLQSLHYLNHTSCFAVEVNPLAKCGLNSLKDYFVGSAPEMKRMLAHHIKVYKARYFEHFCNLEEKQLYPSYGFEE